MSDAFGEHGSIEPVDTDTRIGGLITNFVDEYIRAFVIINEDVAFFAFDQRQDVQLSGHDLALGAQLAHILQIGTPPPGLKAFSMNPRSPR